MDEKKPLYVMITAEEKLKFERAAESLGLEGQKTSLSDFVRVACHHFANELLGKEDAA